VLESVAVTCLAAAWRQKMTLAWLGFRLEHKLVAIEREGAVSAGSAGSAGSASTYQTLPGLP
jgi:hypothetical protein